MKLLYSSHGEAAEIYKLCAPKIPSPERLSELCSLLGSISSASLLPSVTVLDRREIKELVQRSDPQFFLYLRELSVHLKRAYSPLVQSLLSAGYEPVSRVLIRLGGSPEPIEILSAGVLAALCGVKETVLTLDRASLSPRSASACRLCGIEKILLCDELNALAAADRGVLGIAPFSRFVCIGSEELGAAAGMLKGEIDTVFLPEQKFAIFALFEGGSSELVSTDIACLKGDLIPIFISANEDAVSRMTKELSERDSYVLHASSDAETRAILEKCRVFHKNLYGKAPDGTMGVCVDKSSPLMVSVTDPCSAMQIKPTDLMLAPHTEPSSDVAAFARTIAGFVAKGMLSDEESTAIGERF